MWLCRIIEKTDRKFNLKGIYLILNMRAFCRYFEIPYRTNADSWSWESKWLTKKDNLEFDFKRYRAVKADRMKGFIDIFVENRIRLPTFIDLLKISKEWRLGHKKVNWKKATFKSTTEIDRIFKDFDL